MLDFGGIEGDVMAATLRAGPTTLIEADSRDGIFPLGGFALLPPGAKELAAAIFAGWLQPHDRIGAASEICEALNLLARLPLIVPHSSLYVWRRYLLDRTFRRAVIHAIEKSGVDAAPLLAARPGSFLWNVLSERVGHVIGHDDTIDRIFPIAHPEQLVEPADQPVLRVLGIKPPWSSRADRYRTLLLLQTITALAVRPPARKDGRSHVGRLVVIDPPRAIWQSLRLLEDFVTSGLRVAVITSEPEPASAPEKWFGCAPAVIVQRTAGWRCLAAWGDLPGESARRICAREHGAGLLYVHQRGAPAGRWCALESKFLMPPARPEALAIARASGRSQYLVERSAVIENRRRLEEHFERSRRRSATSGLLERAIRMDRLVTAWRHTHRNKGNAGTDGVTIDAFSCGWHERLEALQNAVQQGRYHPKPYLRVWADKESGGKRRLSIPSVVDRVLMSSAADVLEGVLEPVFSDRSFAYRPGRSARGAVSEVLAFPGLGEGWTIIADIASYFDTIDHHLLLAKVREHVADETFVRLIESWIANPSLSDGQEDRPRRGVPQGAPISPILANLCLTPLDRWMEERGVQYVRYADDFVAVCATEDQAGRLVASLEKFLGKELSVALKPAKTQFVHVKDGFEFLGFSINDEGARIPAARLDEARRSVADLLAGPGPDPEVLTRLDAYVRGFRNYFDLGLPEMSAQLEALEADRIRQLCAWARARKLEPALATGHTERFWLADALPHPPPGAYAQEPDIDVPPASLPHAPPSPTTSLQEVDRRTAEVRRRAAASGRPVAVNAGGHLEIFGFGAYAALEEERLVIRRKHELIFEAPVEVLRTIQVDSYGMTISTPLLEKLAELDVPVFFARHGERPWAVVRALASRGSSNLVRAQIEAQSGPVGLDVARELIGAKLCNQQRLLRYYAKYRRRRDAPDGQKLRDSADRIAGIAGELDRLTTEGGDITRTRIFTIEGRGGVAYWDALKVVLGTAFTGRTGRGATDPINVALNYAYGILYAAVWGAIAKSGRICLPS